SPELAKYSSAACRTVVVEKMVATPRRSAAATTRFVCAINRSHAAAEAKSSRSRTPRAHRHPSWPPSDGQCSEQRSAAGSSFADFVIALPSDPGQALTCLRPIQTRAIEEKFMKARSLAAIIIALLFAGSARADATATDGVYAGTL